MFQADHQELWEELVVMCDQLLSKATVLASDDSLERDRDVVNWSDFPVEHWERTRYTF